MINYIALCCKAAGTRARIATLLIDASQIAGTLGIDGAFRAAIGRCANKVGQATTTGASILFTALRIGSTWRWHTRRRWLFRFICLFGWWYRQTADEGIACVARLAGA